DPSGANAFDNASHRYEITVSAALALPPIDAVAWTQLCSHASPPRLGQQSPHHLLGLFQPDGATLFVKVSGDSPIVVGFIGSHVQVISNPLHPSPQRLVLFAPPLGLGKCGGELLSDRPFLLFLLPRIAGKVSQSDLSVRVTHRATGEGVGRLVLPCILSPIPRVAKRTPLHIRHRQHLPLNPTLAQLRPSGTPVRDRRYANGSADTNGPRLVQTRHRLGGAQPPAPRCAFSTLQPRRERRRVRLAAPTPSSGRRWGCSP